ncbi:hypothetical protein EDC03_1353 [Pseudokineococcus lusitanus]|uniref:Uncharacterized protein n=2 Tax=Pseudokineococcus lusitanus TaxID=763993 RepID=A0A3N1HMU0_9ACTN|nr:hypothetical protein EDC03_1353 [Pseudokineococcus lusitanus]
MGDASCMTWGGLAVVLAYMLFAVVVGLVVVAVAAWGPMSQRRRDDDRTGRAVDAGMTRVEAAGERARRSATSAADRALDVAAPVLDRAAERSGRLAAEARRRAAARRAASGRPPAGGGDAAGEGDRLAG